MNISRGERIYVRLSASQTRRRLRGHGFGVRKVESAGRGRAAILHTATGEHLRELQAFFGDVLLPDDPPQQSVAPPERSTDGDRPSDIDAC